MSNLWHVWNWFRVGKNISWKLNFHTLGGYLCFASGDKVFKHSAGRKHAFVLNYLKTEFSAIVEKYRNVEESYAKPERNIIWTLWWQGLESAPELIKACIASIKKHAGKAEVVVITKDNVSDYADIPEYILEKREKGYISFAQLSDILRFLLLEKHGGLWLDSTIFVGHDIPEEAFSRPFYSQHTAWAETTFVQHNLWHGFSIGALPHAKLVSFAKDVFLEYWRTRDTLVDYLMIDYLLFLAYNEFDDIKAEIDGLSYTSERLYDLVKALDDPCEEGWLEELSEECLFSKLDWHRAYKKENKGKPTYYARLLDFSGPSP